MLKHNKKCRPALKRPRHRLTLALDAANWERFLPVLKKEWGDSFTTWVEFAMTCYSQDACEGCPYQEEADKGKGNKPSGIGKTNKANQEG